ncbi:MAG: Ig domain-containing protein [Anaerolineales bacterium]|jgi:hypothetical protein
MHKNSFRIMLAGLAVLLSSSFCILTPRPALEFLPDQMPAAKVGQPYQVDIQIARNVTPAGIYSITDGKLPPGLKLVSDRDLQIGRISGTPSQAGTYKFTVSVWCLGTNTGGQTGEKQYTLVVGE